MEGCPCCVEDEHKREICATPLNKLTEENLTNYTWKAMTTWGEVEDFKHFLPRIFELMTISSFSDIITLEKLEYGEWHTWDKTETDAIKEFLLAWWADVAINKPEFDGHLFVEVLKRTSAIETMLNSWKIDIKTNSIYNLVDFIHHSFTDVVNSAFKFKQFNTGDKLYFVKWVNRQTPLLENAFFHFEKKDPEFAQEISNALYILEHNTIDV